MKVLHLEQLLAGLKELAGASTHPRPARHFPRGSSLKGATGDPSPQGPLEAPEPEPGAVGNCSHRPGPALLSVLQKIEKRRGCFASRCSWLLVLVTAYQLPTCRHTALDRTQRRPEREVSSLNHPQPQ